jgi:hypothetical protein
MKQAALSGVSEGVLLLMSRALWHAHGIIVNRSKQTLSVWILLACAMDLWAAKRQDAMSTVQIEFNLLKIIKGTLVQEAVVVGASTTALISEFEKYTTDNIAIIHSICQMSARVRVNGVSVCTCVCIHAYAEVYSNGRICT